MVGRYGRDYSHSFVTSCLSCCTCCFPSPNSAPKVFKTSCARTQTQSCIKPEMIFSNDFFPSFVSDYLDLSFSSRLTVLKESLKSTRVDANSTPRQIIFLAFSKKIMLTLLIFTLSPDPAVLRCSHYMELFGFRRHPGW